SPNPPRSYCSPASFAASHACAGLPASLCRLHIQFVSRDLEVGVEIFFTGPARHLIGQGGCRRLFVPANLFQIIANVLFVVGLLRSSRRVFAGGPEAGG